MPVTAGSSRVRDEDYNGLRTTVSSIRVTQWNQSLISSAVTGGSTFGVSDSIDAVHWRNLFLDIQSVHVHQTGSLNASLAVPSAGYTVGADTSFNLNQTTYAKTAVTGGTSMGFNDYENAVTTISNYNPSHLSFPAGNFTPSTSTSSSRTASWGAGSTPEAIYHVVTATFTSLAARNYYFNAGGRLAFSASGANGSGAKDTDWTNLLSAMGTVYFDKFATSASSGTATSNNGLNGLTSTYKVLFTKTGSGAYADNYWRLEGRIESNTVLRFRISFVDGDTGTGDLGGVGTGTPIDETVTLDVTSNFSSLRPDSSFVYNSVTYTACDLPHPTRATAVSLATDNSTPPA